jgi:hypothetical protein
MIKGMISRAIDKAISRKAGAFLVSAVAIIFIAANIENQDMAKFAIEKMVYLAGIFIGGQAAVDLTNKITNRKGKNIDT